MINLFGPLRHKTPVFDSDGGGSGGGDDKKEKKSKPKTSGQVTSTGQYAGDGFEWVDDPSKNYKTRTYTGVGKNNGLGQSVSVAGASDNKTKARIAGISLGEGSPYAGSKSSATDGSFGNFFKTGSFGASDSYAAQMGNNNYTPTVGFTANKNAGSFGDAFAAARKSGGPGKTFDYQGKSYTTDYAPKVSNAPATSLRPQLRPAAAPVARPMTGDPEANLFDPTDVGTRPVDYTPTLGGGDPFLDPNRIPSGNAQEYFDGLGFNFAGGLSPSPSSAINYTPTSGGITQLDFDRGDRLAPGNIIDANSPYVFGRPDPAYKIGDRIPSGNAQQFFDERGQEYGEPPGGLYFPYGSGGNNIPSPLPDRGDYDFRAATSTPEEFEAKLAALDAGGVQMAQNSGVASDALTMLELAELERQGKNSNATDFTETSNAPEPVSYRDMFPGAEFPSVFNTDPNAQLGPRAMPDLTFPLGRNDADQGTGYGGLLGAGFLQGAELIGRGVEKGIKYFDPADQYKFGDSSVGLDQLDSDGNIIPEIDMGFAKALGADPNRRGMVAGTENQFANKVGEVADTLGRLKERTLGNLTGTRAKAAKDRDILGTGKLGPDMEALFSEIVFGAPTVGGIVATSVFNPAAGAALGATMTTGELTSEIENRMDARIANGEFGPISKDQQRQLKTDYVQTITPYAASMGVVEGLTYGLGSKFLPGFKSKLGATMLEGGLSEGVGEPSLVASALAGDGQNIVPTLDIDKEGAITGAALGAFGGTLASGANASGTAPFSLTPFSLTNAIRNQTTGPLTNQEPGTMYGQILDPLKSPTAGTVARSTVDTAYDNTVDGTINDPTKFQSGPIVTPRADNNTQVADQTTLMEQELLQKSRDDSAALLSEMILDDAAFEQSATTGNIAELASKLELPMNDAVEVATEVSERAARDKADMLGIIASDEVATTGSINAETLAEINAMLSEEMAADVIEQANANESLDGNTALDLFLEEDINTATAKRQEAERQARETANAQLLSSMSGIELAPMAPERKGPDVAEDIITGTEAPEVTTEVSDLQAQENYKAIAAQEAAYNQTLTETGDAIAAEAAGNAAYNNAVASKLSTPEADGSVTVDNVAPLKPSIADIAAMYDTPKVNAPADMTAPMVSTTDQPIDTRRPDMLGVQPSITEVADQIAAEVEVPVEQQLDLDLETPMDDTVVEVDAPVVSEVQELPSYDAALSDSAKYLRGIVGDGKSQIGEGTVVDNDLQTDFVEVDVPNTLPAVVRPDMLDAVPDSTTEVIVEEKLPTVANPVDVALPAEEVVITEEEPASTMKTVVENPPLLTTQEVPVAVEVPVEKKTNRPFVPFNTAYVPPEVFGGDDGGDDPSIPTFTTTDDGVTVGLPSEGGDGVAPVLGTNVAGDPTMECPEGYELVDAPNGPTCVKIEETYRLRAGASTRPYTGQTIRPGDTGPGQRRKVIDRRTYTAATPAA
jgi:hypothetical protein